MARFEALNSGAEDIDVVANGESRNIDLVEDGETINLGSLPASITLEDAKGTTSVNVDNGDTLELNQSVEFVTHDSVSGTTDQGMTIQDKIDLSKGKYFRYSCRMPGNQDIRLLGESDLIDEAEGTWRTPATGIGGRVLLSTYTPDLLTGSGLNNLEYTFKVQTKEPVIKSINEK